MQVQPEAPQQVILPENVFVPDAEGDYAAGAAVVEHLSAEALGVRREPGLVLAERAVLSDA